jgi:hypothetical protein
MVPDRPRSQVWHTYGNEPLPSRAEALALRGKTVLAMGRGG